MARFELERKREKGRKTERAKEIGRAGEIETERQRQRRGGWMIAKKL